jgi:hypothetical protein
MTLWRCEWTDSDEVPPGESWPDQCERSRNSYTENPVGPALPWVLAIAMKLWV